MKITLTTASYSKQLKGSKMLNFLEKQLMKEQKITLFTYLQLFLSFFQYIVIYNIINCHVLKSLDGMNTGFSIACDLHYHDLE